MTSVNATACGLGFDDEAHDEFEQAQMMCSYEYGGWDDEEYHENEH
jgi:hypothetical protein